jgi:hypothetical protein
LHIKPTCNVVAQQNGTVADLEQWKTDLQLCCI